MVDMTTDLAGQARVLQLAHHRDEAQRFADQLVEGGQRMKDWGYRVPSSDDPETWRGVTRYCYIDYAYRWHIDREVALAKGKGPYFCPLHDDRQPEIGWKALECWPCGWQNRGYDESLKAARSLGKAFITSSQMSRVGVA